MIESSGNSSHAEGWGSMATAESSHAENYSFANGTYSHSEGYGTYANSENQHVQGKFNIKDSDNIYAHIVGNGTPESFSNAHTLDWDGNAWYAGDIECNDIIIKSSTPNSTKKFRIKVFDDGTISAEEVQ